MIRELLPYLALGIFGLQYLSVLYYGLSYWSTSKVRQQKKIQSVSVVIPFRNEFQNLGALIDSLNTANLKGKDVEFIFVDDHSDDNSITQIENKLSIPYKVIQSDQRGKKYAIQQACLIAEKEMILSLDADVKMSETYFDELFDLCKADMWILPVDMQGRGLLGYLASIDFVWLQILTHVNANKGKPFLANGANLLFDREKFLAIDKERKDYHLNSGDDFFLLKAFHKSGFNIQSSRKKALTVQTPAPEKFGVLVAQRKRWLSKMQGNLDARSILLGVLLTTVMMGFVLGIIALCFWWSPIVLGALLLKWASEYVFLRFYKMEKELFKDVFVTLLHQFFYPVYLLSIAFLKKGDDAKWDLKKN